MFGSILRWPTGTTVKPEFGAWGSIYGGGDLTVVPFVLTTKSVVAGNIQLVRIFDRISIAIALNFDFDHDSSD